MNKNIFREILKRVPKAEEVKNGKLRVPTNIQKHLREAKRKNK